MIKKLIFVFCFSCLLQNVLMFPLLSAEEDGNKNQPDSISVKDFGLSPYSLDDGTPWRTYTEINKPRLYGFWGATILLEIYGIVRLKETWYDQPISHFHFIQFRPDAKARKQADKIGHLMHAYFATHLASKLYRWSGFSAKKSITYGALTAWFWILQIELVDAFFAEWGFSTLDLATNTIGVVYAALQQRYPNQLRGIRFKISYHTSDAFRQDLYSETNKNRIDDYEGMTFWLAVNIYDVLPKSAKERYPVWLTPLGISFGQNVQGIANNIYGGERLLFIGLDIDLTKIPTGKSNTLKFTKDILNFVRLPLPTVRITPSTIWFGVYF
jgi:hypothetical protein